MEKRKICHAEQSEGSSNKMLRTAQHNIEKKW